MSVEAIAWANKQRTGSSGAKLVLLALANHADEDGYCWPSRRTLADVTEMSPDSISRHFATLEAAALIEREARYGGRGQRTSDIIRLLIGRRAGVEEAAPPPQIAECPPSANCGGPLRKNGETPSAKTGRHEPSLEPSDEPSPQAPPGAGVGISNSDGEGEGDTQFDVFWPLLRPVPTASRVKALRQWAKLSAADRAQAMAMAPRFVDHCVAAKRKICDPATYLAERRWDGLASLPAAAASSAKAETPARPQEADPVKRAVQWATSGTADRSEWVFVEQGSAAWEEWREAFGLAGYGHRWIAGRHDMIPGPDGQWVRAPKPGRKFPMMFPPKLTSGGSDPPPSSGVSDGEVERYM